MSPDINIVSPTLIGKFVEPEYLIVNGDAYNIYSSLLK